MNLLRQIFTLQNLIAWLVINLMVFGFLGSWLFINIKVLGGHDVAIEAFDEEPLRRRK